MRYLLFLFFILCYSALNSYTIKAKGFVRVKIVEPSDIINTDLYKDYKMINKENYIVYSYINGNFINFVF